MPKFKNTNPHRVSVDGKRLLPGEVVSVDGELADALSATNGVEQANDTEYKEWLNRKQPRDTELTGNNGEGTPVLLAALAKHTVSDPLQTVIGDNDAPHGPDSGTITTKDAVHDAADSSVERVAFPPTGVVQVERQIAKPGGSSVLHPLPEVLRDEEEDDEPPVEDEPPAESAPPAPKKPAPKK